MNRLSAYRLLLVCLCPLLLLLVAAPLLAQTATPESTLTPIASPSVTPSPSGTPTALPSPTATPSPTVAAPTVAPTTAPTVAPTIAPTVAPLPVQPTASIAPTPTPGMVAGGRSDQLVPLLIGGLFLLAALAIIGLLLTRRRRAPRRSVTTTAPSAPAVARPVTTPLPAVGAETVTGVLTPVYLQLEGDAPQTFAIYETPFAIGRDPANNLPIDETFPGWESVSRHHALISRHERGYVIEDLGSQNGVRVNGRLTPKNLLRSGWQVSVGGVTFRFVDETQSN